jgi:hypothetical protein
LLFLGAWQLAINGPSSNSFEMSLRKVTPAVDPSSPVIATTLAVIEPSPLIFLEANKKVSSELVVA